ncbi:MAG: hypothetical protein ACKO0V_00960, partial [bacterium]
NLRKALYLMGLRSRAWSKRLMGGGSRKPTAYFVRGSFKPNKCDFMAGADAFGSFNTGGKARQAGAIQIPKAGKARRGVALQNLINAANRHGGGLCRFSGCDNGKISFP